MDSAVGRQIRLGMDLRRVSTVAHLHQLSGVAETTILRQLRSVNPIRRSTLNKIAAALNCQWHEQWQPDGSMLLVLKVKRPAMRGN